MVKDYFVQKQKQVVFSLRKIEIVKHMMNILSKPMIRNVWDVGCGDGFISAHMALLGNVTATDYDVTNPKNFFKDIEFKNNDILKDDPPYAEFDIVTSFDVLEHIPAGQLGLALDKMKSAVRRGGYIAINIPEKTFGNSDIDNEIDPLRIIEYLDMKLLRFRNYAIQRDEIYNFMLLKKAS